MFSPSSLKHEKMSIGTIMLDLRELTFLVSLARHKNFSRAADDCGISQPAFSIRIRRMEERVGLPLVRRNKVYVGLTREGEVVLKWARKLLADEEGLRQELDSLNNNLDGKLVLGVVPTAMPFAAKVSSVLRSQHSKLLIEIHSLSTDQIELRVNDFSLDAGITYLNDAEPKITTKLYDERYVLIAPEGFVSEPVSEVSWSCAAELPMCLLTPDMRNRQLLDAVFTKINTVPNVVMEASGFTAVFAQVASGNAATIAPVDLAKTFLALSSTQQFSLTNPEVIHSIGFSVKDQSPVLPMIQALQKAINAAL
jgi:DNA-binding transcriptional LysR family regulator